MDKKRFERSGKASRIADRDDMIEIDLAFKEAICLRDAGDIQGAISILRSLYNDHPDNLAILLALGNLFWKSLNYEEAIILFTQATCRSPDSELSSVALFHSLWDAKKKIEALDEAKRFLLRNDSSKYDEIIKGITDSPSAITGELR
jgi:tetratricopeptide (TPR) repeat protein